MGRIMSRHLEELATPRISELGWGGALLCWRKPDWWRQQVKMAGHASGWRRPCRWLVNRKASSDLPKKIETGKRRTKRRRKKKLGESQREAGVFLVLSRGAEVGVLQLTENQAILLQGRHSGLIISHLRFFTFTVMFYSFLMFGMLIFYCLRR